MPSDQKSLKELATKNRTQLGDPISLKAETSERNPTEDEKGASSGEDKGGRKSLKQMAKENPTMLGDPVSLKAEKTSGSDPTDHDNGPSATEPRRRNSKL